MLCMIAGFIVYLVSELIICAYKRVYGTLRGTTGSYHR